MKISRWALAVALLAMAQAGLVLGQQAGRYQQETNPDTTNGFQLTSWSSFASSLGGGNEGGGGSGGGLIGGAEATYVKPYFDLDLAYTLIVDGGGGFDTAHINQNFNWDYELAPRLYLGWGNCDSTARVRYWEFDQGSGTESFTDTFGDTGIFSPGTPTVQGGISGGGGSFGTGAIDDTITARSGLDMYVFDAEAGRKLSFCGADVLAGSGVRYANFNQTYLAQIDDLIGPVAASGVDQSVWGVGPTVFVELLRPVTCNLSLVLNARASFLFGEFRYAAFDVDAIGGFADAARFDGDTTLRIYEMQTGVQYEREMSNGAAVFVRATWEAQMWEGVARDSAVSAGDMGLAGGALAIGLDR